MISVVASLLLLLFNFAQILGTYLSVDTPEPRFSDIIVILGGGWDERVAEGEQLLGRGLSTRVLLTGVSSARDASGMPTDRRYLILRKVGVSADSIYLDSSARNTWQEVHVIRDLLRTNGWHTVLMVSDPPHLRRLSWVCNRVLGKTEIEYTVVPTHPVWWDKMHWWRNGRSVWFVVQEYFKLLGYHLLYF